jgi:hypothetical protein
MPRYAAITEAAAGTTLTLQNLTGSAATRPKIYDLILGSDTAPADVATDLRVSRSTTAGTGTAVAEDPLDPLTAAVSIATMQQGTFSPVPTRTTDLLAIHLNQRATFRWVAAPGGELIAAAVAANGIEVFSIASGGTPNMGITTHWEE